MKGLLAILGKPKGAPDMGASDASVASPDAPGGDDTAFQNAATQVMDTLKNNDAPGFAEALKACIEMSA